MRMNLSKEYDYILSCESLDTGRRYTKDEAADLVNAAWPYIGKLYDMVNDYIIKHRIDIDYDVPSKDRHIKFVTSQPFIDKEVLDAKYVDDDNRRNILLVEIDFGKVLDNLDDPNLQRRIDEMRSKYFKRFDVFVDNTVNKKLPRWLRTYWDEDDLILHVDIWPPYWPEYRKLMGIK